MKMTRDAEYDLATGNGIQLIRNDVIYLKTTSYHEPVRFVYQRDYAR